MSSEPFIVNIADAKAFASRNAGTYVPFEDRDDPFADFGINIHVLAPGEPNAKYHSEVAQESFLMLSGEAIVILDGVERPLRQWDFVHCPAGTEHVFIGAGDGPCAILMVGVRRRGAEVEVHYPANELAARYGAVAPEPTSDPEAAYSDWDRELTETRLDWPPAS